MTHPSGVFVYLFHLRLICKCKQRKYYSWRSHQFS